ncbi:MAG: LamG domain-containing protein [Planctomycetaceae bacterium]|nr:LamG domain-containing protein [Planctomycetaceae bacterium]
MKTIVLAVAAVCLLSMNPLLPLAGEPPIRLAVDLLDGSRVIGTTRNDAVRIKTEFGESKVPLRLTDSVRWKRDRENVVVEFPNGDRLTGGIIPEVVPLTTLFGEVQISMEHIVMLKPVPAELAGLAVMDGLVLHFPFDEAPKAGVVASRVGPLHGKQQGGQWIPRGHRGGAFQFANSADCILVADQELLQPKMLTISVWVNPDNNAPSSTWRGIMTKSTSGSWNNGFGLSRYPGSPDAHFFVNYYSAETAHAKIPDDTWTHLAATYDEQTLTLYINGEKAASAIPQGSYGGPIQYGPSPLLIGKGSDGYGWFGKLDEVMLFNRVLSAQEINRLYQLTMDD